MLLKLLRANIQFLFKTYYKERKVFKKSKRRLTGINAETSLRKPKRLEATHEKEYGYKVPKEAANRTRKD